ncbi:hypothetical protein [Burkholderia sp. MSMB617WGS]|uniref:hypothetical protein n=1 Tax=Burkholderia sp. MSMB617WGS TaxID=1637831 RepID=UPI000A3F9307|nr:hypothetical protein [Burkholderia sp. MSMB617WGS]
MSGALRHFLESEDAVNSSGGETVARAAAGRGSTAGAVAARAAARLLSVCRRFGVSVFRCFGVSVFRCFGVSVFRCVDIRGARID